MSSKVRHRLKIVSNKKICPRFYSLKTGLNPDLKKACPGQFIHIRINEGTDPFFRRPFSIAGTRGHLKIIYEVVGNGTELLSSKKAGEIIDVMGPLGTGFSLPPEGVKNVVMIAGGVGVAPLLALSDALMNKSYDMSLLYGGRTEEYVFSMKEIKAKRCKVRVATDNGSVGTKGRVDKLFSEIRGGPSDTFVYACGPRPMLASVQKFAKKTGINGQASFEEVMACGVGTCLGCSVQTKQGFRTVCHDGPVFDLDEIELDSKKPLTKKVDSQ